MILYAVRYMTATAPGCVQTDTWGPWDYWSNAKARRNYLFGTLPSRITHCWIERTEAGLTLSRAGAVMKR